MDYRIENLTKENAEYIGKKINEIVPHEVDADEEEFVVNSIMQTVSGFTYLWDLRKRIGLCASGKNCSFWFKGIMF